MKTQNSEPGSDEEFHLRACFKSDLAQWYSPGLSKRHAMKRLNDYIEQTSGLYEALLETGYTKTQRYLRKSQVSVIVDFIGEP